jgi:hypothetical protein
MLKDKIPRKKYQYDVKIFNAEQQDIEAIKRYRSKFMKITLNLASLHSPPSRRTLRWVTMI